MNPDTCATCKHSARRSLTCAACLDYDLWSPAPWSWPKRILVWLLILGALAVGLWGPTP